MKFEEIVQLGKELGYVGEDLQKFVTAREAKEEEREPVSHVIFAKIEGGTDAEPNSVFAAEVQLVFSLGKLQVETAVVFNGHPVDKGVATFRVDDEHLQGGQVTAVGFRAHKA